MSETTRAEIHAFLERIARAILAQGPATPEAMADALNRQGLTTRRGRSWSAATVAKFLTSPGAARALRAAAEAQATSPSGRTPSITN
ncbi:MAG: hypothetical protein FJX65_09120 [Alphaproteobacteria bacterium]|nr:hypothetical protein [Alphaproteobacteria bacterium]